MKEGLTEIVFILDKSGSMEGLESDTIGGYNSFLKKQKEGEGEAIVTTVFFNDRTELIHDRQKLEDVKKLTEEDYEPCGCTALLDAVGETVEKIETIQTHIRKEDVPEKTIFVITTDGMENSSTKYTYKEVKKMISKKQEKDNWQFIFLGANIDAAETAESMGIKRSHAVEYKCDGKGVETNFDCLSDVVMECRSCAMGDFESILSTPENWKKVKEHLKK